MQLTTILALLGGCLALQASAAPALRLRSAGFLRATQPSLGHEAMPLSLLETGLTQINVTSNFSMGGLPTMDELENVLASLEEDKRSGKVTPGMANFVKVVTGMIKNDMLPAIATAHFDAKLTLRKFELGFAACGKIRSVSQGQIRSLSSTKSSTYRSHRSCRYHEEKLWKVKDACQKVVAEKLKAKKEACGAYRALIKDPTSEANNCHTTNTAEPYGLWLSRNKKDFLQKLNQFNAAKARCTAAHKAWYRVSVPCSKKTLTWSRYRKVCNYRQTGFEVSSCTLGKKMTDTCKTYDTCYDQQLMLYKKMEPKMKVQEKDRKGEFRALKRIECLLTEVFGDKAQQGVHGSVESDEIDKCKAKTHSTVHLNLRYPKIPDKKKCGKVPPVPGVSAFWRAYYSVKYKKLPPNSKPKQMQKCVLEPGGGVIMNVWRYSRRDRCSVENGWLRAQYSGSCGIADINKHAVTVDYTKRRFTRYRFLMKMDETSSRNGRWEGGGFEICNRKRTDQWRRGSDQQIGFQDNGNAKYWGYRPWGQWNGYVRSRGAVKCKDMMATYNVWGGKGRGIDVSKYTAGKLKWIGCMGDGCAWNTFYCNDRGDTIEFGTSGTLRALIGTKDGSVPQTKHSERPWPGCCSAKHPHSVCNALDTTADINILCRQLGYTRGTVLAKRRANSCPEVSFSKSKGWSSDFKYSLGYGHRFRCQGPAARTMYTSKAYYKAAEPKAGVSKQWDLTMEYKGGKYFVHSLKIQGVDFSGYRGALTNCPTSSRYWGFMPRISAWGRGKVWIKDFRVYQGNSLKKPFKQVVGEGIGLHAARQKRLIMAAAIRAAKRLPKCSASGFPQTWWTSHMIRQRGGTVFRKNPRVRRGWNTWAVLPNVQSFKFRIIQRKYQHIRVGLTYYSRPHLHYPNGRAWGVYPGGRLLVEGYRWMRWRVGDVIETRIQGRYYCSYLNGKRLRCWRQAPSSGRAYLQIHAHEAAEGIQAERICTIR